MRRIDPFFILLALVAVLYLNIAYNAVTGRFACQGFESNLTYNATLTIEVPRGTVEALYAVLLDFVFVLFPVMAIIHVALSASR